MALHITLLWNRGLRILEMGCWSLTRHCTNIPESSVKENFANVCTLHNNWPVLDNGCCIRVLTRRLSVDKSINYECTVVFKRATRLSHPCKQFAVEVPHTQANCYDIKYNMDERQNTPWEIVNLILLTRALRFMLLTPHQSDCLNLTRYFMVLKSMKLLKWKDTNQRCC